MTVVQKKAVQKGWESPPLSRTKGEPVHEDEPARRFENRGRFDNFNLHGNFENFDSEWSVRRVTPCSHWELSVWRPIPTWPPNPSAASELGPPKILAIHG
jgi:hypothetical protein